VVLQQWTLFTVNIGLDKQEYLFNLSLTFASISVSLSGTQIQFG